MMVSEATSQKREKIKNKKIKTPEK